MLANERDDFFKSHYLVEASCGWLVHPKDFYLMLMETQGWEMNVY